MERKDKSKYLTSKIIEVLLFYAILELGFTNSSIIGKAYCLYSTPSLEMKVTVTDNRQNVFKKMDKVLILSDTNTYYRH